MIKKFGIHNFMFSRIDGKRLNCRVKYLCKIRNLQYILGRTCISLTTGISLTTCISMTTCLDGVLLFPGEVVGEFILHPGLDESVTAQL